jgi:hypothetical protein
MAHVGHTAASMNVFLDIPMFLRGLSQSLYLYRSDNHTLAISNKLKNEIQLHNPSDPTGIYNEYLDDWWNFEKEWETHPVEVNHVTAFKWHIQKVNENFIFGPDADVPPNR